MSRRDLEPPPTPPLPEPPPGGYRLGLADVPWPYRDRGTRLHPEYAGAQRGRAAYRVMTLDEVAALPVRRLFAPDAALGFWIPGALLLEGAHAPVLRGWGFRAVQICPWIKTTRDRSRVRMGGGHYSRLCSEELVLALAEGAAEAADDRLVLAARGRAASLRLDAGVLGLVVGPPAERRHSSKPDGAYEMLETLFPGPRIELFARRRRPGWDAWGDQAPDETPQEAAS